MGKERRTPDIGQRISEIKARSQVAVTGVVKEASAVPHGNVTACRVVLADQTGELALLFLGRGEIAGMVPGVCLRVWGMANQDGGGPVLWNPRYEFVSVIE